MRNAPNRWKGRYKQVGGRLCKLWGRWTRDQGREFIGEMIIVEGKLEEYYASRRERNPAADANFRERRHSLNVVV